MLMQPELIILVDTREKKNQHILKYFDAKNIPYRKQALKSGDYSLEANGIQQDIWIERKNSLDELIGNFTRSRIRFKHEFERTPSAIKILLVEDNTYADIINGAYASKMNPKALLGSLLTWQWRYDVRIFFVPRAYSGNLIYHQFKYYLREMCGK